MSSMYAQFKTSDTVEKTGIFLDYGSFRVRVLRTGGANQKYRISFRKNMAPFERLFTAKIKPSESQELDIAAALRKVYAESVIVEWETYCEELDRYVSGIEQADGDIVPFSKEVVLTTLEALPLLFEDIQTQAGDHRLFLESTLSGAVKN